MMWPRFQRPVLEAKEKLLFFLAKIKKNLGGYGIFEACL